MSTVSSRPITGRAVIIGTAQAVIWGLICLTVIQIVPRFQRVFADFGVELPAMTVLLISLSRLLYTYWYVTLLAAGLLNWGVASVLSSRQEGSRGRRAWYLATWLVPATLTGFVVIALLLPLLSLVTAISR